MKEIYPNGNNKNKQMHHIRHHFGEETQESFGLSMEEGGKIIGQ